MTPLIAGRRDKRAAEEGGRVIMSPLDHRVASGATRVGSHHISSKPPRHDDSSGATGVVYARTGEGGDKIITARIAS